MHFNYAALILHRYEVARQKEKQFQALGAAIVAAVCLVTLAAFCVIAPILTVLLVAVLATTLAVVWLNSRWIREPRDVAMLLNVGVGVPAVGYHLVVLMDGILTCAGGAAGWTSFDVITPLGFRPMHADTAIIYGALALVLTVTIAALLRGAAMRASRRRRRPNVESLEGG